MTLIELLITMVLLSIMAGAIWLVYGVGLKVHYSQGSRTGVKAETGAAFIRMTRELHGAISVTLATATSVTFTADTDNNGEVETITYSWSGAAGAPLDRTKTLPVPSETFSLINSVNGLAFSYYAADSATPLTFPVTPSDVKLVSIDVTSADTGETFHLRTKIRLESI